MTDALWKDLLKSLLDKVLIGALIGLGGYIWTYWIQADTTFWETEAKRLQTESELFAKLVPPGQSIIPGSLHGSAMLAMAKNGRREADLRLCTVARTTYANWCGPRLESTATAPDDSAYLTHRVITPGRLAFYDAITTDTSKEVSKASAAAQQTVAQSVDGSFRSDPGRDKVINQLAQGGSVDQAVRDAATTAGSSTPALPASVQQLARSLPVRVYIQAEDIAARTAAAEEVRQQMQKRASEDPTCANYLVPPVERLPSAKMPRTAQIRYFADQDLDKALRLQACLKQITPAVDAAPVRVPLKAPLNQIELWFARTGS
jgi:hypothetical protein